MDVGAEAYMDVFTASAVLSPVSRRRRIEATIWKEDRASPCRLSGASYNAARVAGQWSESMIFEGKALQVDRLPGGNARVDFNLRDSSVNKFNRQTLKELRTAVDEVAKAGVSGLVFTSSKPAFIVGADITEFPAMFSEAGRTIARLAQGKQRDIQRHRRPAFPHRVGD